MTSTERLAKLMEENSEIFRNCGISKSEMESTIGSLMHPYELKAADLRRISESLHKLVRKGRGGR